MAPPSNRRRSLAIEIPESMTFKPNMEEFRDFKGYIEQLEKRGAHKAGICKIVPPEEWVPRKAGYGVDTFKFQIEAPVKQVRGK